MSSSAIAGSWHAGGYYGHDRSKTYNECAQKYRRLATPGPPSLFNSRSQLPRSTHAFSEHDSRRALSCGPIYFEHNIGRRRNSSLRSDDRNQRDFLTWLPDKELEKRGGSEQPNSSVSSYTVDYRGVQVDLPQMNQRLVRHLRDSVDEEKRTPISTYRLVHCSLYPQLLDASKLPSTSNVGVKNIEKTKTPAQLNALNGAPLRNEEATAASQMLSNRCAGKRRSQTSRDSVARCMIWYQPPTTKQTATQTVSVETDETVNQKSQASFQSVENQRMGISDVPVVVKSSNSLTSVAEISKVSPIVAL